jgi:hypothetical protein
MKFKKRYIDGLYWKNTISDSEEAIKTEKGRLFHLLAYRYLLGLDCGVGNADEDYKELDGWMKRLKNFISPNEGSSFYPEYELKLSDEILKIQAKYDLISIEENGKVVIYDWKVQEKPLNRKRVENAYQTIIYRYLLAKLGEVIKGEKINPENISMVYWQPTHPTDAVRIDYSQEMYEKDEQFLKSEIDKILTCDFESNSLKTADQKTCRYCEYCAICNDVNPDINSITIDEELEFDWDEIGEIEF